MHDIVYHCDATSSGLLGKLEDNGRPKLIPFAHNIFRNTLNMVCTRGESTYFRIPDGRAFITSTADVISCRE